MLRATEHSKQNQRGNVSSHTCHEAAISGKGKRKYGPTAELIADMGTKLLGLQKVLQLGKLMPSTASLPFVDKE